MLLALLTSAYVGLHFCFYLAVFRELAVGKREAGIFIYHAASFGFLAIAAVVAGSLGKVSLWPTLLLTVGLHGSYSLTFLELWSLTQGGYSLAILNAVDLAGGLGFDKLARMAQVGSVKRSVRMESLHRLGLGSGQHGAFELSRRGRVAAAAMAGIVWLSRGRTLN